MMDNFAVFILSHGRPNKVITVKTLLRQNYNGDYFIVVDDEDTTLDEYKKNFGERCVVFSKKEASEIVDTCDAINNHRGVVYARNEVFNIAKKLGYRYFLVLDDDYRHFAFRYGEDNSLKSLETRNLGKIFEFFVNFLKSTDVLTITMAQGGDFIGGLNSGSFHKGLVRKAMNSFFCDVERPFRFIGRVNEDTNAYVLLGNQGKLLFMYTKFMLNQKQTQSNAGGMTELYLDSGTYVKSFYSVIVAPQAVKITTMGENHKRIHHFVNWNLCTPKILNEKYKK